MGDHDVSSGSCYGKRDRMLFTEWGETTAKVENAGGSKDGASADGVKEITMWYQENKTMIPAFDQRVEDFNKKYEGKYHLTIEYIPRGSSYAYEDKVNSAAAAGILAGSSFFRRSKCF